MFFETITLDRIAALGQLGEDAIALLAEPMKSPSYCRTASAVTTWSRNFV